MSERLEGLLWIARYPDYCITFARELEEVEMLSRFVEDPSRASLLPELIEDEKQREQLEDLEDENPLVFVGSYGGWAFALEIEGSHEGAEREVLRRVSEGTIAVSLSYPYERYVWSYAENGVVWGPWEGRNGQPDQDGDRLRVLREQADREYPPDDRLAFARVLGIQLDKEAVAERPLFRTYILLAEEA